MKTQEQLSEEKFVADIFVAEKPAEIKDVLLAEWDKYDTTLELATAVMNGYIFGKYASNEHYQIDDIVALAKEIELEKNPKEEVVNEIVNE